MSELPEIVDLTYHVEKAEATSPKCEIALSLISSKSEDIGTKNYAGKVNIFILFRSINILLIIDNDRSLIFFSD